MRIAGDRQSTPRLRSPDYFRPLLKWAGGKRQLLPHLRRFYPPAFNRYIEPFFGSGAVFFDLYAAGRLRDRDVVLIDSNADLIGCYETVRAQPDQVAARARSARRRARAAAAETQYYAVRDGQFNPARDRLRGGDGRIAYTPQLAAMLIYLNRTGFNGLFRLNARGQFNVPAGRYERPRIARSREAGARAAALSARGCGWSGDRSSRSLEIAAPGDFVYFDPPYAPFSRTANFTSYTGAAFDAEDQRRLQRIVHRARRARLLGAAEQLDRRRDHRALRATTRTRAPRACARSASRRAAPSTATRRCAGRSRNT